MPKGAVYRIKKYQRKLDVENIAKQLHQARDDMIARAAEAQADLMENENKTKSLLSEFGIPTIDYPRYFNFMRQGWKARKGFAGATLENEVAILMVKWQMRGCDEAILIKIRDDILGVPPPRTRKK